MGSGDLRATKTNIDILEWFENFFTVKDGTDDRNGTEVLFEESQIGYLPEERGLYPKKTIIDQLTYFAELKGNEP